MNFTSTEANMQIIIMSLRQLNILWDQKAIKQQFMVQRACDKYETSKAMSSKCGKRSSAVFAFAKLISLR